MRCLRNSTARREISQLLELVIIELFDILRKMLTLYEWERWLMPFCLTNQEICGVNVLK